MPDIDKSIIELEAEEAVVMGSFNHGCIQANLASILKKNTQHRVGIEVSLDLGTIDSGSFNIKAKEELKPDLCVYSKRNLNRFQDVLKMTEMPLLAVEILSPKQGTYDILEKFKVYFALGIPSCWLVEPVSGSLMVYQRDAQDKPQTFFSGEVVDECLNIRFELAEVFE